MFRSIITLLVFASLIFIQIVNSQSNPSIEFIGSVGGKVTDFAIYEDPESNKIYCYIAQGAAIIIFDVTDHTNPIEINRIFPRPFPINNISLSGDKLALSSGYPKSELLSLKNPKKPMIEQKIPSGDEIHLSGNKLSTIKLDRFTGSGRPIFSNSVFDISDLNNPVNIGASAVFYNSFPSIPRLLHVANSEYNTPHFYWLTYSPSRFGWIIWFDIEQSNYPPEIPKYDNQIIPALNEILTTSLPKLYGTVAYQDRLYMTYPDKFLSYDPRITNVTPETITIPLSGITGPPLLDKNLLYIPTEFEYKVYDLIIPTEPLFLYKTPLSSFEPRYINKGIAYGFENEKVIIQSINPFEQNMIIVEPGTHLSVDQILIYDEDYPMEKYSYSQHPATVHGHDMTMSYQELFIHLTDDTIASQQSIYRLLYIQNTESVHYPQPDYLEAYYVADVVEPRGSIEGNILSFPTRNGSTYYFRLGGDLFTTSIPNWKLH